MFARIIKIVTEGPQRCRNCDDSHKRQEMKYDQLWGWFCDDRCFVHYSSAHEVASGLLQGSAE